VLTAPAVSGPPSAGQALAFERRVLLKKLREIEQALEQLTAVRVHLSREIVNHAVRSLRTRQERKLERHRTEMNERCAAATIHS
jgi:hypothetical protein